MQQFVLIVTRLGKVYIYISILIQGFEKFSQNMLGHYIFLL